MKWLFAVACLLILHESAAQQPSYALRGQVVDQESRSPLEGAVISSHEMESLTLTDASGAFFLPGLRAGRHHIHVELIGYRAMASYVDVPQVQDSLLLFELLPTTIELSQVLLESSLSRSEYNQQTLDLMTIGADDFQKSPEITLARSLSRLPGVQVVQTGVSIARPVIRGLSGNRILVSDLGLKQEGQQWGNDHGLEIDPFGVGRTEVIKGPSTLLFGPDAMGGVIHILPPSVPQEGFRGVWQTTARSGNELLGSSLMLEGNKKGRFARVRFTTQQFGDYRVPADTFTYLRRTFPIVNNRLKNTAGREYHGAVTLGVVGQKGSLKWTTTNYHQLAGLFPGIIGVPTGASVADDGDARNVDLPRVTINHFKSALNSVIHRPGGWLQIDAGVQQNVRIEQIRPMREGYGPLPTSDEAYRLTLNSAQVTARWHMNQVENWKFIPGGSLQFLQHTRKGHEFLLPNYSQWMGGVFFLAEHRKPDANSTINGGLRIDAGHFSNESVSTPIWTPGEVIAGYNVRAIASDKRFSAISASAGWSWYEHRAFNVKVNVGKSFRVPNAAEWTVNGVHHGTFRHEQGNPELRPEHGYQLDLVLLYEKRSFYLKLSPFVNVFEGFIYLSPSAAFSELPDGGQVYQYRQDDAVFVGGELLVEYHPIEALHLESILDYVHSYNLETALALPFTPPLRFRFNAEYERKWKGRRLHTASVGMNQHFVFDQMHVDRNERVTPGFMVSDAFAGVAFRAGSNDIDCRLVLTNLWNANYLNHLSIYRQLNLPEQGRNVTIMIRVPIL